MKFSAKFFQRLEGGVETNVEIADYLKCCNLNNDGERCISRKDNKNFSLFILKYSVETAVGVFKVY